MTDLTPEKRAELRRAALGRASLTVPANDFVALLDAADERIDRAINRTLDYPTGRVLWALLSLAVIYAAGWHLASIIGAVS